MPMPNPLPFASAPGEPRLGSARYLVQDVGAAVAVWRDLIGLQVQSRDAQGARLGLGGREMVRLTAGATAPAPARALGLFHLAVHVPRRADLAQVAQRMRTNGRRHSGQDHLMSIALYCDDADGNGIEIAFDTPGRGRIEVATDGSFRAETDDGAPHTLLEPLNIDALVAELPSDAGAGGGLPDGAFLGHIHFRTNARAAMFAFYTKVIGLRPNINSPAMKFCDTGVPSRNHMVAFNMWGGAGLPVRDRGAAGLASYALMLPDAQALYALRGRLEAAGAVAADEDDGLACRDPEGNLVRFGMLDSASG